MTTTIVGPGGTVVADQGADGAESWNVTVDNDPANLALSAQTAALTSASTLTVSPSTPGDGIRLWWVSAIPDPDNSSTGVVTVTLPTASGDDVKYRAAALAHRQRFDGDADEDLVVAVVGSGSFDVTVHYQEYTP